MSEIDPEQEVIIEKARDWIIDRIKILRLARGYTQGQVTKKMGVHWTRVSDLELGRNDYKVSTMLRAAYALGVTAEALLRGCPGMGNRRATSSDPLVIVSADLLKTRLTEAGLAPRAAASLVESLVREHA